MIKTKTEIWRRALVLVVVFAMLSGIVQPSVFSLGGMTAAAAEEVHTVTLGDGVTLKSEIDKIYGNNHSNESVYGKFIISTTGNRKIDAVDTTYIAKTTNISILDFSGAVFAENKVPDNAFNQYFRLNGVVLPEGVQIVGKAAFENCEYLKIFNFPASVKTIMKNAFANTALTAVSGEGVTTIEFGAFYYCRTLLSANFPTLTATGDPFLNDDVWGFDKGVFQRCDALQSLTLSPAVEIIGSKLLQGCTQVDDTWMAAFWEKHPNIAVVGQEAFSDTKISHLTLPTSVKTISKNAFASISTLVSVDFTANTFSALSKGLFTGCVVLNDVKWGNCLPAIPPSTFSGCSAFTEESMSLPDSVTRLGTAAFEKTGVRTYTIPSSVKTIESSLFSSCTKLTNVVFPDNITKITDSMFSDCPAISEQSFTIPSTISEIGRRAFEGTGFVRPTIPNTVSIMGSFVFMDCKSLITPTLSTSVTRIPEGTFSGCASMSENTFAIPSFITGIGNYAFEGTGYDLASIPDTVKTLGDYVFSGCIKLRRLTLPSHFTTIPAGTFSGCTSLSEKTYKIPDFVTQLNDFVFENTGYKNAILPDQLTSIGKGTFSGCKQLLNATFPESFTVIPDSTFADCIALNENTVEIPGRFTSFGNSVFAGTGMVLYTIPDFITKIGSNLFSGCKKLQNVTFPEAITAIPDRTFSGCTALSEVTFVWPSQVTSIGKQAFENTSFKMLMIPSSITSMGIGAFSWCKIESISYSGAMEAFDINTVFPPAYYDILKSVDLSDSQVKKITAYSYRYLADIRLPDTVTEVNITGNVLDFSGGYLKAWKDNYTGTGAYGNQSPSFSASFDAEPTIVIKNNNTTQFPNIYLESIRWGGRLDVKESSWLASAYVAPVEQWRMYSGNDPWKPVEANNIIPSDNTGLMEIQGTFKTDYNLSVTKMVQVVPEGEYISDNAFLNAIRIQGIKMANFSATTFTYGSLYAPYLSQDYAEEYTVEVVKSHPNATVTINDVETTDSGATVSATVPFEQTDSSLPTIMQLKIKVQAENTTASPKTYTVRFKRLGQKAEDDNSNALLSQLWVNNALLAQNPSSTTTWVGDLPTTCSTREGAGIKAVPQNLKSTVTISGPTTLRVGITPVVVTVTAPDNVTKQEYTLHLNRLPALETTPEDQVSPYLSILKDLKVDGVSVANFDSNRLMYQMNVPYNTTTIALTAIPVSEKSSSRIIAASKLREGNNTVQIVVKSWDGSTTTTYKLAIIRQPKVVDPNDTDTSLTDLKIDTDTIPGFASDKTTFTVEVESDVSVLSVTATPKVTGATWYVSSGTNVLKVGRNTMPIVVCSRDKTQTQTYIVYVTRKEHVPDPNDIEVGIKALSYGSAAATIVDGNISYSLKSDQMNATLICTPKVAEATVSIQSPANNKIGRNTYFVTVKSKDGSVSRRYTVYVTLTALVIKDPEGDIATLKDIQLNNATIASFDKDRYSYSITVPYQTETATISADTSISGALVSGTGFNDLNVGRNTVRLAVTSKDRSTKLYYTLYITRLADASNANLASLSLGGVQGHLDSTTVRFTVSARTTSVSLMAVAQSTLAQVKVENAETLNALNIGDNTVTVKVTAGDKNTTKDYTLIITKPEEPQKGTDEASANLAELSINGIIVPGFQADQLTYAITVDRSVSSVSIGAAAANQLAETAFNVNQTIEVGMNTITVQVTSKNGLIEKSYTITITRL